MSFDVPAGKTVAVVGSTGAGKSTLANLLLRFYDVQEGSVRVSGVDVRELRAAELRKRIGYVQQDVFIFGGTLSENVRLGEEAIGEERVRQAVRAVRAERFIEALGGYEVDLRERGNLLSTGQKQLVALARCLAFDPEIFVLDEATSAVDTLTERLIQEAIATLAAGRTSLIIAHRLQTVMAADRIVVLHKGKVHEQGTHAQLLARGGLYRRLCELQFGFASDSGRRVAGERAG